MQLCKLAEPFRCLSIIGICKNAGKTTVLNYLIQNLRALPLGITSIGRDGENTDVVTGTRKPRVFIGEGTLAATASGLLPYCTATKEIVWTSGIPTPLGEVVVLRARSEGYIELAGPSIASQLEPVKTVLTEKGAQHILIDGALSRKTFASSRKEDAVILSAGASYHKSMQNVIEATGHICDLYGLPEAQSLQAAIQDETQSWLPDAALQPPQDQMLECWAESAVLTTLYHAQALTDTMLGPLLRRGYHFDKKVLAVRDTGKLLISRKTLQALRAKGASLQVLHPVTLIAVTANPVSTYGYRFPQKEFCDAMQAALPVPVFDIGPNGIL